MKCLIVDDDERWRNVLAEELTLLGFECHFAKNDTEAIRSIKAAGDSGNPFRFITLDHQMAEMGNRAGPRVLSFLNSYLTATQIETVCIVISGTSSVIDVRNYFKQYPVYDFIPKADPDIWERLKKTVARLRSNSVVVEGSTDGGNLQTTPDVSTRELLKRKQSIELAQVLATRFDAEELRRLCFHLNIDYDDLPGAGKTTKATELVYHFERRNSISELIQIGRQLRPDISWSLAFPGS